MTQRYRLADQVKVANDVSALLYAAAEALEPNNATMTPGARAKLRGDLIGMSAGALTHKPPASVLETLVWVVEMAQDRATGADFNTPQEALDEHHALAFVADWLEAQGLDVTIIRRAQPSRAVLAELVEARDKAQAELDALEAAATELDPTWRTTSAVIDALQTFTDSTSAETHASDVIATLEAAGFKIVKQEEG